MAPRIIKTDLAFLTDLADFRLMTLSQIAVLRGGSDRSARRRMQQLLDAGYVETLSTKTGKGRGRPETVYSLGAGGFTELRDRNLVTSLIPFEKVSGRTLEPQAAHQIALNWCRIRFQQLTLVLPEIGFAFISCNSPFALDANSGHPAVRDYIPEPDGNGRIWFIPDAAIALTDASHAKTVAFFLEVDMGTESTSGASSNDIQTKMSRYQEYFRSGGYKRYEKIWNVSLAGFRLLFVVNTPQRARAICATVRVMPPSGFVWVAELPDILDKGAGQRIWVCGGELGGERRSILGSLWHPDIPGPRVPS